MLSLEGWRPYVWIALAALLPHARTPSFELVNLDDDALIVEDQAFLSDVSNVGQAFGRNLFAARPTDAKSYYRPILTISYLFDFQRGGTSPTAYHWTNLALHLGASLALFRFLLRLGGSRSRATIGACLFAAHPLAASVVAWIPGRNDSLLAVFVLTSALAYLRHVERPTAGNAAAHLALFALALFTKEAAIVLPVALLALRFVTSAPRGSVAPASPSWRTPADLGIYAGWIVALGLWFVLRSAAVDPIDPAMALGSIATHAPHSMPLLGKVALPLGLSTYPVAADQSLGLGIAGIALGAAAVWAAGATLLSTALGIGWIALFLLPGLVMQESAAEGLHFEHRMYVTMIGFLIAAIAHRSPSRIPVSTTQKAILPATAAVVVGFAALTFAHDGHYARPLALWQNAAATSPNAARTHLFLGRYLAEDGQLQAAAASLEHARSMDPELPTLDENLGRVYFERGDFADAAASFRRSMERSPSDPTPAFLTGRAELKLDRPREAIAAFERALEIDAAHVESYEYLAMIHCRLGDAATTRRYVARIRDLGGTLSESTRRVVAPCMPGQ